MKKRINKKAILFNFVALSLLGTTALNAEFGYKETAQEKALYAKDLQEAGEKHSVKSKKKKKAKQKYAGWYMRTRVSATATDGTVYQHNSAGVFGKLKQSRWKKDRHDIPAYGTAALQVVFPHYNWGEEDSGDYWSDYRKYKKSKAGKRTVWTFLVRNQKTVDLSNASIEIMLGGQQNVDFIKKGKDVTYIEIDIDTQKRNDFTLVDVDNKETYSVDELKHANLSMDGKHTRTFRWVRGEVKKRDFRPVKMPE